MNCKRGWLERGKKKLKRFLVSFFMVVIANLFLVACSSSDNEVENSNKLKIYTTLFAIEDFTNKIGGDYVDVTNIIPAGGDAHSFEPTINQMIEIAEGDLFIYSSPKFETYVETILEAVKDHKVETLVASEGIDFYHVEQLDDDSHDHGNEDPHVWLDPLRAIQLAENIKKKLVTLLPEQEDVFQENFERLKSELEALDNEFLQMRDKVTKDTIVVSHAAYSYWEDRYDIFQMPISGLSPTNEPSVKQMRQIISFIEDEGIEYVMFEKNIPSNYVETIKEETDTEALWLHNLESISPEERDSGADYFDLMRSNLETLRTALQ